MTTYSFIQYDILKDIMYLKATPTPGLTDILDSSSTSDPLVRDILINLNSDQLNALDNETADLLKSFLDVTPEINLAEALYVAFTVEIIDDVEVGDVLLVATNLDKTKTYVTKGGTSLTPIINAILPVSKYPTLGKCRDCFKFTFGKDHVFNFVGNIGGYSWTGNYKNGQKEYQFSMPDFSTAANFGTTTPYTIFWKPNITTTVTLYGGATLTITNKNKWIAVPTANIGTANELNNQAFFHYLSGTEAPCPYASNPTNPNWNFQGNQGFFLLENVNPIFTPFQSTPKECPTFKPSPGNVDWGWNCGPDGDCVAAPSGSIGTYVSYSICIENCTGTGSYGWDCTPNGCVEGTITNTGSYTTLQECIDSKCGSPNSGSDISTTCPCDPLTNLITNPGFSNGISGYSNWGITPTTFTPGVGNWIQGEGFAQAEVVTQLNVDGTSSVSLVKNELFTPSCSYDVCFQAWQADASVDSFITLGFGQPLPISPAHTIQNLTTTPTAYSFTITAGSPSLTFYLGTALGTAARIYIDNVCVTLIGCPPESSGSSDCIITGSSYCYADVEYDCLCPEGYTASGSQCVGSGSIILPKIITGTPYSAPAVSSPAWGWGRPVLYYNYDVTGSTFSSTLPGNQSPLFGDPTVFNTQFTFDILSASFWRAGGPNNLANTHMRDSQLSATWIGGGSFIEVTGSLDKILYAALIGDDVFRLRVDSTNEVTINSATALTNLNNTQINARSIGSNPYIPYNLNNIITNYTYNCWHIYPITIKPGCHSITLEGRDVSGSISGFAGFIFDNTDVEIAHANSLSDLNIIWDSSIDLLYDFDNSPITASCPAGSTPLGPDPCDLCEKTIGNIINCGDCINCANGTLYNGYTVDNGGYTLQGRGPGGIVNTNVVDNPTNTWVIPTESDWNTLVTYLNGGVAPTNVLATGSLGVPVGGKMKDYVRDLNATCWEFPNIGAQNDANSSGWAGIAAGKRDNLGVFSGLGLNGIWWSANSTPTSLITQLATRELTYWTNEVYRNIYTKNNGFSIRLVRPAVAGEIDGTTILAAYKGNDGKIYDGVVIGTQVWIVQNLDETEYNDASLITFTTSNAIWNNAINTAIPTACYYDNNSQNANIIQGSIDPITGICFEYPTFYLYQKCGGTELLLQSEPGATTTIGEIQKDENSICWEFVEIINTNPTISVSINFTGNYFANNNTVYNDCEECNAIHTIYMSFDTKNC